LELLGHQSQQNHLDELWRSTRLPHALLLTGPEGIGKRMVALQLTEKILASNSMENHPDLFAIEPEEGRIKVESIREIKRALAFPPLKAPHRVVLINDAHAMNAAAANALLKSLEEPPLGTYFILITHAPGWLPRTIVSRCQTLRFSPLAPEQIRQILETEKVELPEALLAWAQGSPLKARQLSQVASTLPSLRSLLPSREALDFAGAYALASQVVEENVLEPFLGGLLASTHQVLTHPRKNNRYDFDLLVFADRILEISLALRQNIQPHLHLNRLLLFFQEPKESRYASAQ
jgi:DNA polymerase III delta' subunit